MSTCFHCTLDGIDLTAARFQPFAKVCLRPYYRDEATSRIAYIKLTGGAAYSVTSQLSSDGSESVYLAALINCCPVCGRILCAEAPYGDEEDEADG